MLARIADREETEQTTSLEAVRSGSACLSRPFDRQLVFKI